MLVDNRWKVLVLVTGLFLAQAIDSPGRSSRRIYTGLSRYPVVPYRSTPMFVPRNRYKKSRQSRVLFLDDEESSKQLGRGEIDLTESQTKVKFDETTDFDFTSPDAETEPKEYDIKELESSGNERYFEQRRPFPIPPKFYTGRYSRPYAPSYYEPYYTSFPSVRNGFYGIPSPNGWKARSPRVVFPYQETGVNAIGFQTNSHQGGTNFADNVVFRDQNFGLNDVSSTDDLALQELGTGAASATAADSFADRGRAGDPHHAKRQMINRMDSILDMLLRRPKYIPLIGEYSTNKPLLPDSTKILPPIDQKTVANVTKVIGDQVAYIPKFKPINDEEMFRIDKLFTNPMQTEVFTEVPYKKYRKGKKLEFGEELQETNAIETTEPTALTTKYVERQDEKKCPQGGSCEFFIYCWMIGGLLEGTCGLLKGCCHRVAKAGILGVQDTNTIEYSSESEAALTNYGPVINDQNTDKIPKTTYARCLVTACTKNRGDEVASGGAAGARGSTTSRRARSER